MRDFPPRRATIAHASLTRSFGGFVLSVQRGNHYQVVGDEDVIAIHEGLDFVAVTGDDNS